MTATELLASTGQFAFTNTAPVSATGTPLDSVTVTLRIFARQEATILPPYLIQNLGVDPNVPGT